VLEELLENEVFCTGVAVGIQLHQDRVVEAHKRKMPLVIDGTLYYLQDGRERLQDVIDRICR
jgi:hypothetical protein